VTGAPSPRPRVLVSVAGFGRASEAPLQQLVTAGCDVIPNPTGSRLTEDAMLNLVTDIDAIVAGTEPITARVLDAAPRLKIIARRGVGFDTVDIPAATARGIPVTITAGVLSEAVADHAFGLLLAAARQIPHLDREVKAGGWDRSPAVDVHGKTLGIVGFGAIGKAVARRGAGFRMRVLAYDVAPDHAAATALGVRLCDFDTLLAESDFVTVHAPLSPVTRHLIGDAALRKMKAAAFLINTSRGDLVDEAALLRALREGRLAGAGLDVFHDEPVRDRELVSLAQVVATPHVASHTRETLARMESSCADAVIAALRGERPAHVVNPEVYAR
jgi:D-3-phosphoglycerate dehydrogenase